MDTKTLTRNFYTALSEGRLDAIDELVAEDFVEHEATPTEADGRDGLRELFTALHAAFTDFAMNIDDMVAEGDKVFVRATMQGIQRAEFMGIRRRASRCSCRWPTSCVSNTGGLSSTGV